MTLLRSNYYSCNKSCDVKHLSHYKMYTNTLFTKTCYRNILRYYILSHMQLNLNRLILKKCKSCLVNINHYVIQTNEKIFYQERGDEN